METVTIIGIDLAKRVFQAHGATSDGTVAFRKKLSHSLLLKFLATQPPCIVAMEACATAHEWGRVIGELGHTVRLVPPVYVKPFVKRQKNDASDYASGWSGRGPSTPSGQYAGALIGLLRISQTSVSHVNNDSLQLR